MCVCVSFNTILIYNQNTWPGRKPTWLTMRWSNDQMIKNFWSNIELSYLHIKKVTVTQIVLHTQTHISCTQYPNEIIQANDITVILWEEVAKVLGNVKRVIKTVEMLVYGKSLYMTLYWSWKWIATDLYKFSLWKY